MMTQFCTKSFQQHGNFFGRLWYKSEGGVSPGAIRTSANCGKYFKTAHFFQTGKKDHGSCRGGPNLT
eukprot:1968183-Rhodomonas_salina.1